MTDDDVVSALRLGRLVSVWVRHVHHRVLGAVERGAEQLGHARVQLQKGVALRERGAG